LQAEVEKGIEEMSNGDAVRKRFELSERLAVEISVGGRDGFRCLWVPGIPGKGDVPTLTRAERLHYLIARGEMFDLYAELTGRNVIVFLSPEDLEALASAPDAELHCAGVRTVPPSGSTH
jgi:hypothetical protein